jgi:hypothetical protein
LPRPRLSCGVDLCRRHNFVDQPNR